MLFVLFLEITKHFRDQNNGRLIAAPTDSIHALLKIDSLKRRSRCLPLWGRWQPEGLTEEVQPPQAALGKFEFAEDYR
jgi:hypothetical protein